MAEIGAYEAKTHLPQLLDRVRNGERIVITKHGRPVAELVPVAVRDVERIRASIAELRVIRGRLARRGVRVKSVKQERRSLRELAHEGHRY